MTKEELLTTAEHIQICLSEDEVNSLLPQVNDVLKYVGVIDSYDCGKEEELLFMTEGYNRLREDVAAESVSLKDALKNAPVKNENFFKVPKVIE
jgi:aspartyl-tRNA(Asn)/glutamyl-tRNA(Gln) amidotransferase subunit C